METSAAAQFTARRPVSVAIEGKAAHSPLVFGPPVPATVF
jgi:hypothetical protein